MRIAIVWTVVIGGIGAAVYCFMPLARVAWDTLKHRHYMWTRKREEAKWKPTQMSESWKRTHLYDKEGDAA